MRQESITFCIFSYNRGAFLENCVASIRACLPRSEIIIFDDNSSDSQTQEYLSRVGSSCQVVQPGLQGQVKHGGLYHNMNAALQLCADRSLLCFLQDDTQLVRPVPDTEVAAMHDLFERFEGLGFLHPCFIRGDTMRRRPVKPRPGPDPAVFFRQDTGQSAGIHYSDLVLFRPARLLEAGWSFLQSEAKNDAQAKCLFGPMAYFWLPFAMWLPQVPAYRGKRKTLGLRLAERKRQVGFYPFRIWSTEFLQAARDRAGEAVPVAEDWLECMPKDPPKPWTYNPLSGLWFHKGLNNAEVLVGRWLGQLRRGRSD
ncbi:MAG: glycosyltransferase family 2 protein [Halothiobacillaceae bacterium]